MTSSASACRVAAVAAVAVVVLVVASAAAATARDAALDGTEPPIAPVVRALVAERWGVAADHVHLDFGRAAEQVSAVPSAATCRLAGKGADGYFVCLFHVGADVERAVRVRAGVREVIPVAAHALAAGSTLTAGDFTTMASLHWGPPGATAPITPSVGGVLRRALAPGEVVRAGDAAASQVVRQGQPVRVIWTRGAVHLEWSGVALNAARAGERVRTRVDGRADAASGIATADGAVVLAEISR